MSLVCFALVSKDESIHTHSLSNPPLTPGGHDHARPRDPGHPNAEHRRPQPQVTCPTESRRSSTSATFLCSSPLPHTKAASFPIINAVKRRQRGRGSGEARRKASPQPTAGSFLVRGKASNEGWRCQPGSPAELQGAHLCSQLAHRSSIKAHACCQEQRPEGRPF